MKRKGKKSKLKQINSTYVFKTKEEEENETKLTHNKVTYAENNFFYRMEMQNIRI